MKIKNQITLIGNEIETMSASDISTKFYDAIGISPEQLNGLMMAYNQILNSLAMVANARVEAWQTVKQATEEEMAQARDYYEEQLELREQGLANEAEAAKRELAMKKKRDEKAQKQLEKAERAQAKINDIMAVSSMIVASAQLFRVLSLLGPIGIGIAIGTIGTMFGAFASAKAQAKKASRFGDGGVFDIEGGTHASGNDTSLETHGGRERRVERGEKVGVISARSVRKYGSEIDEIIQSLNDGTFDKKFLAPKDEVVAVHSEGGVDRELLDAHMAQMSKFNKELSKVPRTDWNVGRKGIEKTVRIGRTTYLDIQEENKFGS